MKPVIGLAVTGPDVDRRLGVENPGMSWTGGTSSTLMGMLPPTAGSIVAEIDGARVDPVSGRSELAEEGDHRGVDLGEPLLLSPVAATGKHERLTQLRHDGSEIGDQPVHAGEGHHCRGRRRCRAPGS